MRDDSRVKIELSNSALPLNTVLMASMCDSLAFLSWTKTKEAQRGQKRPKSILSAILDSKAEKDIETFEDGKEFSQKWLELTGA